MTQQPHRVKRCTRIHARRHLLYGQESNATTRHLAIMNLAIRGVEARCDQPEAPLTTTQTESHRFLEASLHHALPA